MINKRYTKRGESPTLQSGSKAVLDRTHTTVLMKRDQMLLQIEKRHITTQVCITSFDLFVTLGLRCTTQHHLFTVCESLPN